MTPPLRQLLPATSGYERKHALEREEDAPRKTVRRSTNACESCRTHKSKCSGEQPTCKSCAQRDLVCKYVQTGTRQLKQNYKTLQKNQTKHEGLISLVRTLPEREAMDLFLRIRAGGDAEQIVNQVKDGNLLLQLQLASESRLRYELPYSREMPALLVATKSLYLDSFVYEVTSQNALHSKSLQNHTTSNCEQDAVGLIPEYQIQYVKPYHAGVIVEPQLENVRPSEWTTISKDDSLLRDLLAAYFTYEYPLFPVFQKDLFLEDMANRKLTGQKTDCCSDLLVNAILAYACYCSPTISNRYRYWEPQSLGYRFLAEAKRIWEIQYIGGKCHNLTSVQAALIINAIYNICALDKIGTSYGLQGFAIAQDMKLFDGSLEIESQRVRKARNFTAWCLFNIDSHLAWAFFRHPVITKPPQFELPDPSANSAWYGEIWTRYPLSPVLTPTCYGQVFKATSNFRVMLNELSHASFGGKSRLPVQQATRFLSRLIRWHEDLPLVLTPKYIVLPTHFLMHLEYHFTLISICQPFIHDKWDNELSPRGLVLSSERDINIIMRLYYLRHGFGATDISLVYPLSKLGFMYLKTLKDNLSLQNLQYIQSTLLLALTGLREQGRSYYLARTVYRILKNQLRPEEARLLDESEDPEEGLDEYVGTGEVQSAWKPQILDISIEPAVDELSTLANHFWNSR